MIGLEYVMATHLILAGQKVECKMPVAPKINVSATGIDLKIINTKGIRDLDAMTPIVDTPFEKGTVVHREGLRLGMIGVSGGSGYSTQTYPSLGLVCMYVTEVNVKITFDPTIYIAREYKPGTCHYNAILEHEMKHVKLDRQIVNKYTNTIARAVDNTLKKVGYAHGPYRVEQLPALQKQIAGIINSVVEQFSNNLNAENRALQKSTVDTLEEYMRVDALCPDKPRPVIQ